MKNLLLITLLAFSITSCDMPTTQSGIPKSTTGVSKATAKITVQANGLTTEQSNVQRRLQEDNDPGAVKYAYCISPFSGEVLFQSTVKGKITSSGKRLSPYSVAANDGQYVGGQHHGEKVAIGNNYRRTAEVLQDDGTYGSSIPYVFWWDVTDVYHQHYITGGQIFIVRDQPMTVNRVGVDMNVRTEE